VPSPERPRSPDYSASSPPRPPTGDERIQQQEFRRQQELRERQQRQRQLNIQRASQALAPGIGRLLSFNNR
jgi:hypothetical protein